MNPKTNEPGCEHTMPLQKEATPPKDPLELHLRLRTVIGALKAHPGDEYLLRDLCHHVDRAVRESLISEVQRLRPFYGDRRVLITLRTTFERLCKRVIDEVRAQNLSLCDLGDPTEFFVGLVFDILADVLNEIDAQEEPPPFIQFRNARYSEGLTRALGEMDEQSSYLLHLRLRLGFSFADMGELLQMPDVAVRLSFESAVRQLKDLLGS